MFAGLGLGLLLRGCKWATRTPPQDDRCGGMGWFGCYSAGALMDDYLRRVSQVLRLQGATDWGPQAETRQRPPTAAAQ
jgi:hypothetical protein